MGNASKEEVAEEISAEEVKNEEAAERLSEESTDLASELASEEKEPGEFMADGVAEKSEEIESIAEKSTNAVNDGFIPSQDEIKEIKDFEETFNGKNPLKVLVELNARIKELEKKVF